METRLSYAESLESRTVFDGAGLGACPIDFEDSQWVTELEDDALRFASLVVGKIQTFGEPEVLDDEAIIRVRDHQLTMGQTKELLHGFADSLGTDAIIETLDFLVSPWGTGSGSTTAQFEDFIVEQLENQQPCTGLRFTGPVRFELPGEGGDFFTGGFLEIDENGRGGILLGGDIVQVVEGYEIEATVSQTTLTVRGELLGEVVFAVNRDFTLTDEFGRSWDPDGRDYGLANPSVTDELLGDLDEDGAVAYTDFLLLFENFGKQSETGDLDGNGTVDFADFQILSGNFGNKLG